MLLQNKFYFISSLEVLETGLLFIFFSMKKILFGLLAVCLLASCTKNTKKIIVYSRGVAVIDKDAKTIVAKSDDKSQEEQTIEYNTADPVELNVTSQAGEAKVSIPENGYYILNAKNDTIVGSYQAYSAPKSEQNVLSQEAIKQKIDSLQQLVEGKNISAANRNFYILPNHAVKVTDNLDAFIVGPFHRMTSIEATPGKEPEVYRFFSIKEVRETIDKLVLLTK